MKRQVILILLLVLMAGCSSAPNAAPVIPATSTATPSPIPATATFTPSLLPSTDLPVNGDVYVPIPRYMLISRPSTQVEIQGNKWQYVTDKWGDRYGLISFRDPEAEKEFTQVFILLQNGETREEVFGPYPDGSQKLDVKSNFDVFGNFIVMGLLQEGASLFLTELQTDNYLYIVQITMLGDDSLSLEELYVQQASELADYLLQDSLQRSRVIPRPPPTPLAPDQQTSYDSMGSRLISEEEINALYSALAGVWEYQFDVVKTTQICRIFEDRTPADVLWFDFRNCVFKVKHGTSMDKVIEFFFRPGDVELESKYANDQYFVFSYQSGHIYYVAILYEYENDLAFLAELESRALVGMTAENGFSESIDDILNDVLMENVGKKNE